MENTIKVTICTGTTCYVLGGSQLMVLDELLPTDLENIISLEGSNCLNYCKDQAKYGKPPYVIINDHIISDATPTKIIDFIHHMREEDESHS